MFTQHAEHDPTADAIYVYLSDTPIARTTRLDDYRNIDLDAEGGVVGVEFLGVSAGVDTRDIPFRPRVEQLIEGFGLPIFA